MFSSLAILVKENEGISSPVWGLLSQYISVRSSQEAGRVIGE